MVTIGLLYPGDSAADDFEHLAEPLAAHDVRLVVQQTEVGVDAHEVQALLDLGSSQRLLAGAEQITEPLDAISWACTSGSFVFGWDGAREQVAELARATGVPASSTSLAFVRACRALAATRVAVAASYPQDVAEHFTAFLAAGGIEVVTMSSHDIHTAAEVGTMDRAAVEDLVAGVAGHGAQAILVPDTAMHTLSHLEHLEQVAGLPVLTANQVTVFDALALVDRLVRLDGFGSLFARSEVLHR